MAMERHSTGNSVLVVRTIKVCSDELNQLARDLVHVEHGICDLASEKRASPKLVKSLQDLDRIQQSMFALATVLDSIGSNEEVEEAISNLPLESLRLKFQHCDHSEQESFGTLSLF